MHVVLASAFVSLLVAVVGSILLMRRSGDPRAALLAGAFALFAAAVAMALGSLGQRSLGFDLLSTASLLALGASLACPLLVLAVARTLRERDRSESLHFHSMETVRALADLAAISSLDPESRIGRLLEIGCEQFGLEIGIASRVAGERYEIVAMRAPQGFPVTRGAAFPLESTWCQHAVASPRPVDVARVSGSGWSDHAARSSFPFESYLGTAVRVRGEVRGTLAFASLAPRSERFNATEKDLLTLMGRWLGAELERAESRAAAPAREAAGPERRRRLSPGWEERSVAARPAAVVDLNAVLRRLERRLARAAGSGVELSLSLADDLEVARHPRLPLDDVVLSLVSHAASAMPGPATLELATANLEVSASEPGVLPSAAPDRYVTLTLLASGAGADADAFARAFEESGPDAYRSGGPNRLSLPALYRMLQRCGGDLSVDVERGRDATFTVFLPRAVERPVGVEAGIGPPAPAAGA